MSGHRKIIQIMCTYKAGSAGAEAQTASRLRIGASIDYEQETGGAFRVFTDSAARPRGPAENQMIPTCNGFALADRL